MSPARSDSASGSHPDSAAEALRPHRVPKLAEIIAAELRARILGGELSPGESLLGESTLMEQYAVSRPTLREALRLLEAQNLIVVRRGSHKGPVVVHPEVDVVARAVAIQLILREATLADVVQFRTIYEPTAARMAAQAASADAVAVLREVLSEEERVLDDHNAFARVSWRFHSVLIGMAGNATMDIITESLQYISAKDAAMAMSSAPDRASWSRKSLKAHRRLVDLIEAGDAEQAERFWAEHMRVVAEMQSPWSHDRRITELLD
ncbi:FadR/GntR family transcriptional regulator [uncultured Jatrophihabitans sp.]|uniref:FadR/GntR family transcriptional regulator n=1 Tax=uncultured Jatrophihabitans sp. TaxID=1610747 RepID=UPI0035CAB2DE